MFEKIKFIIENLKTIVFAGVVFWLLIVLSLQLAGLVNIETQCNGHCADFIKSIIHSAEASTGPMVASVSAPIQVTVHLLP